MNKLAVITGATKGIGKAIAEAFATEGYNLAVCSRHQKDLDAFKTAFEKQFTGIQVVCFRADVSEKTEVLAFADFIKKTYQNVQVLVNNAGVFFPGTIEEEADGVLEKMIATNLYSAYHLTRALLPLIENSKEGHIFNMCSVASLKAYENGGSYGISKYALLGFNHNLRASLKNKGIKVTAIVPGATWSDSWAGFEAPTDRLMQPDDIAQAVICAVKMRPSAVVEEIIIRPLLGDL